VAVPHAARGFPAGYFSARDNAGARPLSVGGLCEEAIAGLLSGVTSFGRHIGVLHVHFLGSGRAQMVLAEAGLDGESQ
jgi:hypothetical protein